MHVKILQKISAQLYREGAEKMLFSNTISLLEKALDYSSTKQTIIADNIANVDTPNYKAKDVQFKDVLNAEMNKGVKAYRTDKRHYSFNSSHPSSKITTRNNIRYNHNGNSVDVDYEMTELAKNQLYYHAMTDLINGKFQTLQSVIRGGK